MSEIVHVSRSKIVQEMPPLRRGYFEGFDEGVPYGVHGGIAKFYGVEDAENIPATLDHMIAAIAA